MMQGERAGEIRVLAATGMLGTGFREDSFESALALKPHVIGCDAGSTDGGPFYLGSGRPSQSREAVERDLRLMIRGGMRLGVPVLVGSAGTAGGDAQVDWLRDIVLDIARSEGLGFRLAVIHAEQSRARVLDLYRAGRIRPLAPPVPISEPVIERASHIVGMMGVEPFIAAIRAGAQVVIAGRASDTAIFASLPILRGIPEGIAWHAAKILECGAAAAVNRVSPDCMFAWLRQDHFVVCPLNPEMRCTPQSVASHALYENSDPFLLKECSGTLDLSRAGYAQEDARAVRVTGSAFIPAETYTVKLEAAERIGFQSMFYGAVRDPVIIRQIDSWLDRLQAKVRERAAQVFGAEAAERDYLLVARVFGRDGTMGTMEPTPTPAHEICLIFEVTAVSQKMANALAAMARHIALHQPVPEWSGLITVLAAPHSYLERGEVYRFTLNHVAVPDEPLEMFPMTLTDIPAVPEAALAAG